MRPVVRSHDGGPMVLRGSAANARVRPWPGDPTTAQLVMYDQSRIPTLEDLAGWLDRLESLGYEAVRSGALHPALGRAVEQIGFIHVQALVLLEHTSPWTSTRHRTPRPPRPTHRLHEEQHHDVAEIDAAAFAAPWSLDARAIVDVCAATARHRARTTSEGRQMVGFAISGRDGRTGFLQRLAIHPDHHRRGHASALVTDCLRWLDRWRVERVLVNTHADNVGALALYDRHGFRRLPEPLGVYQRAL